jgi:cytochrome c553
MRPFISTSLAILLALTLASPGLVGQEQAARLAGQDFDYLLRLLRAFKARTASDLDGTMTVATQPLTDDEIVSLVHFVATLGEP